MLPVLRHDLKVIPSPAGEVVRVEDPVRSECFEFTAAQWQATLALAKASNLDAWLAERIIGSRDPQQDRQGWTLFLQRLAHAGLLQGIPAATSIHSGFCDPLAFRLGSLATHPWLPHLERALRPLANRFCLSLLAIITLFSHVILIGQWPRLFDEAFALSHNLSPWSLVLLPPVLMLTKTLHELGHAISAERLGARSREMGIMLFFGAPCLYADVSSVNLLPDRRDRIIVTLAGSAVDLAVGAIAGWIWSLTVSGVLHDLAWLTLTVIVGTNLIFNLNPLMRFDGYYLLTDLLNIPNLHLKAQKALVLRRKRLGWRHWWSRTPLPNASWSLACFALAALLYRTFVLVGVSLAAIASAASVGLGWAMATALTLLVLRRYWRNRSLATSRSGSSTKLGPTLLRWSVASALLLLMAMTPWRGRVSGEGSIYRAQTIPLYALESGRMIDSKRNGEAVQEGDVWISLVSPEVDAEEIAAQSRCEELEKRIESFKRLGSDESGESLTTLEQKLEAAQSKRHLLERRRKSLSPLAPLSGQLISAPHQPPNATQSDQNQEPTNWCGDPLHSANRGAWIESGTLLGWLVPDRGPWEAVVAIDEGQVSQVQLGDTATLWTRSAGKLTTRAQVVRIGSEAREVAPNSWDAWVGSVMQGTPSERRCAWVLLRVETEGESSPQAPRIHDEPVRVSIHTRPESMLSRAWRWWRTQVYFPW